MGSQNEEIYGFNRTAPRCWQHRADVHPAQRELVVVQKSRSSFWTRRPIIPAVRMLEMLMAALSAPGKIVFFWCGSLVRNSREYPGNDRTSCVEWQGAYRQSRSRRRFCPRICHCFVTGQAKSAGLSSTHSERLGAARAQGLFSIERTFLLDSAALKSSPRPRAFCAGGA